MRDSEPISKVPPLPELNASCFAVLPLPAAAQRPSQAASFVVVHLVRVRPSSALAIETAPSRLLSKV